MYPLLSYLGFPVALMLNLLRTSPPKVEIIPDSSQTSKIALESLTSRISQLAETSQVAVTTLLLGNRLCCY